jgi:acetyl-CoA carboxylase beta subunit
MARPLERRAAVGKTRSCPHCRATILESAAVCPACRHHLRFESRRRGEQLVQAPSEVAFKVSGRVARPTARGAAEYHVVVVIRDARGTELERKVIGVGGLPPGDERNVELSVEIFDPAPGT